MFASTVDGSRVLDRHQCAMAATETSSCTEGMKRRDSEGRTAPKHLGGVLAWLLYERLEQVRNRDRDTTLLPPTTRASSV